MSKHRKYTVSAAWPEQKPNHIILPICIRSPAVQGGKFIKTLEEIAEIRHIHVVLCDLLDRHNLAGIYDRPDLASTELADRWLAQYGPHMARIIPQHDLTRWTEIQAQPGFKARLKAVDTAYYKGGEVRTMIDNMALYYFERKRQRRENQGITLNQADELQRSAAYLVEEMAGDMTYGEMFPGAPRVYWGLYVSDPDMFNRNLPEIGYSRDFPPTIPLTVSHLSPSVGTAELGQNNRATARTLNVA